MDNNAREGGNPGNAELGFGVPQNQTEHAELGFSVPMEYQI
jgi:hypothetical protein